MNNTKQEKLREFVENEVITSQSYLVNEMLKNDTFSYNDIENYIKTDDELKDERYEDISEARDNGEDRKEIFEWWIVSNWLLNKLKEQGEPVLSNDYGEWWGRCCTGQAILLDSIIETIYDALHKTDSE